MKDFETDPKVGTKIPEDLLEIIKRVIVGKSNSQSFLSQVATRHHIKHKSVSSVATLGINNIF